MEGEARYSATSLESLIHFSTSKLGRNVNVLTNDDVSTFTFLPSFEVLKWIRDSNDVAQYLASPSMAGSSQTSSSFFIISASADFSFRENRFKISVACWMKRAWIQQLDSQEYEFGVGMKKVADKSVVCQKMNYPYAVFYCHTFTKTRTYMIPLVGVDGSKSKAMAACHSDTSAWHPQHVAFQVLKIKSGTVPVCHFLHNNAMVWIRKYIKEGGTVSVMGVVQRNENVLMIVPPPEPFPTGCQWAKCILPASLEGIVLRCEDTSKIDVIPV